MPRQAGLVVPRPYPNLMAAVADGLDEVFSKGFYADRVVSQLLKRDARWGSRDRAFIAQTVYDCVRWWRLLSYLGESNEPEALVSAYWAWHYGTVLEAYGFPVFELETIEARLASADGKRALIESIPDWMDEVCEAEIGDRWPQVLSALNKQADVYLRTNTLKTDRETLKSALEQQGYELETDSRVPEALKVVKRKNLWATKEFKAGHFEVQDIASQHVAHALQVEPGMLVVDACAGAGGKALHLAALMKNKGRLIAMDIEPRKLVELKRRAKRAGISNLDIRPIENSKAIKRLHSKADRVLLDVPCSGLGVLRRNPDAKWKMKPEFLAEVEGWQADILARYSAMTKVGGRLVYATCSILPSESENQVTSFLSAVASESQEHANWELETQRRLSPTDGFDGFYFATLGLK